MEGMAGNEAIAADAVEGFDSLHDVDGEWKFSDPRLSRRLVLQVEFGGGGV